MKKASATKRIIIVLSTIIFLLAMQTVQAEGVLPSLTEVEGIGLPSLGEALRRYPDNEMKNEDGSVTELYINVTDMDYDTFRAYMTEQGAEPGDCRNENGVLTAELKVRGVSFSFSYDSFRHEAKVTYPAGTYNDWIRNSKMLLSSVQKNLEENNAGEAIAGILRIPQYENYDPVQELIRNETELASALKVHEEKLIPYQSIGGIVTFGRYEQDPENEGLEPIEWIVLDYDEIENKALLITRYGLKWVRYGEQNAKGTYETSDLRSWVTGSFMNTAFAEKEQKAILTTEVDNSASQGYPVFKPMNENNTQDKAFILSYAEARKYFGIGETTNFGAQTMPTPYLLSTETYQNAVTSTAEDAGYWLSMLSFWWLRSPGKGIVAKACVTGSGMFSEWVKADMGWSLLARPAIWLDLNADII